MAGHPARCLQPACHTMGVIGALMGECARSRPDPRANGGTPMSRHAYADHALDEAARQDRLFRAARRHTLLVRSLRRLLPAAGGVALACFAFADLFSSVVPTGIAGAAVRGLAQGAIVMDAPKVSGFTRDERSYRVTAERAQHQLSDPNLIEMRGISAAFTLEDGKAASVKAQNGVFDNRSKRLLLQGSVRLHSEKGYSLEAETAEVDIDKDRIVSDGAVRARMGAMDTQAQHMTVSEGGERILFEGRVKTTLVPGENQPAAAGGN